jgi:hypothetical protein
MARPLNILERRKREDKVYARYCELIEKGEKMPYAVLACEFPIKKPTIVALVARKHKEASDGGTAEA